MALVGLSFNLMFAFVGVCLDVMADPWKETLGGNEREYMEVNGDWDLL